MPASLLVEQRKMIFYNKIYVVTILFSESCVVFIAMRPQNCHLYITFFLYTQAVLTLKGPFGQVF